MTRPMPTRIATTEKAWCRAAPTVRARAHVAASQRALRPRLAYGRYAPAGSRSACTAAAKYSPRSSAEANMSNEAQPGESSTTSPGCATSRARRDGFFHRARAERSAPSTAARSRRPPRRSAPRPLRARRTTWPISRKSVPFDFPPAISTTGGRMHAARRSRHPGSSPSNRRRNACRRSRPPFGAGATWA